MKSYVVLVTILTAACLLWKSHGPQFLENADQPSTEKLDPSEEFFLQKQYPVGSFSIAAYLKAMQQALEYSKSTANRTSGDWVVEGPGNIGARANAIAVNPKNPDHMLIGFSEGGLFLTMDGGKLWEPVFDQQLSLSVGDVVFDPSNPQIVYAGTGDPNISGFPFIGNGLYKSVDGGKTWKQSGLQPTRVISQIRVSNQNPGTIYVGAMGLPFEKNTHKGLYKSTDGGDSWKQILLINDSTGICDVAIHPENDQIIYAASWNRIRNNKVSVVAGPDARIYKSIDGGNSWKILSGGLPMDASSRIGIDISRSNPNILYACYTHPSSLNLKGIFRTDDAGNNWRSLPISQADGLGENVYAGFGWYFGKIRVNPTDPNDVFLLAVDIFRSKDGGTSWKSAGPPWWSYEVHADKHDLIFVENKMYLTTDGGAYSSDIGSEKWTDIENIPTTQFYRVAYNPHSPDVHFGGAQDNGSSGGNASIINDWPRIYGGDGFQMVFHPKDSALFYVETQNGGIAVTTNGGSTYTGATFGIQASDPRNWDMPYMMSRHNPDVMFAGTNKLYKSTTGADVDYKAISPDLTDPSSDFLRHNISTIDQSYDYENHLLVGTSDGLVWLSQDGGATWTKISLNLPKKYVSSCSFSPSGSIYVSYTGYKDNDFTPYIFESVDNGKTWRSIQGNLPRAAVNNILPLPPDSDVINANVAVATDVGVYFTSSAGKEWKRIGNNMPLLTVYDVEYNPATNQIIAGTFGRGIQSFDLQQIGYPQPSKTNSTNITSDVRLRSNLIALTEPLTIFNESGNQRLAYVADHCGRIIWSGTILNQMEEVYLPTYLKAGVYFFVCYGQNTKNEKTIRFLVH